MMKSPLPAFVPRSETDYKTNETEMEQPVSLNVTLLRDSFEKVKPVAELAVTRFYQILWADYPESKTLFAAVDMNLQKQALIQSLVYIVDHLESSEELITYLKSMGGRHVKYGLVSETPYQWVGNSLLKSFGEFFGAQWTKELVTEWTAAYALISAAMIEGMKAVLATRQNSVALLNTHPQVATAPMPNLIPEPAAPQTESAIPEPAPVSPKTIYSVPPPTAVPSQTGYSFELPQTAMSEISKAASDLMRTQIEQEFKKALHLKLNTLSVRDLTITGFELPAEVVTVISNKANAHVRSRIEQEFKKALHAELEQMSAREFVDPLKKAA